jgi:hypothetical protein
MNDRQRRIFAIILAVALIGGLLIAIAAPIIAN